MFASYSKLLNGIWLLLMVLTISSGWLAESADPSLLVTFFIAATVSLKGIMVVEHFMELKYAHPYIRFSMGLFFVVMPILMILVFLYPEQIADLTRL